jgi:prepilin peptidase CpaA
MSISFNSGVAGLILPPALLWVLLTDLLYRRIANGVVLVLLATWLASVCSLVVLENGAAPDWGALGTGLLSAALVLALGYALFAMRWVGAGDVKLTAVLCLWCAGEAPTFLVVTSLAGGILALGLPFVKAVEIALAHGVNRLSLILPAIAALPRPVALRSGDTPGLPYGLAIAAGAAFVLYSP